jgi:hypothetical protein
MDSLDGRMDRLDGRMDKVESRFDSVDTKFNAIDARFNVIDEKLDTLCNHVGGLDNTLGKFSELLVLPGVLRAFCAKGYTPVEVTQNKKFRLESRTVAEVDILLKDEHGRYIAIEVKSRVNVDQINEYPVKLDVIRTVIKSKDKQFKQLDGAYLSLVPSDEIQQAILAAGFHALMTKGLDVELHIPEHSSNMAFN